MTIRISPLDALATGPRPYIVMGPLQARNAEAFAPVLDAIATGGSANRIGLIPRRDTLDWSYEVDRLPAAVDPSCAVDGRDIAASLNRLVRIPVTEPVQGYITDGYLGISFDHGIGDSHLMIETMAALSRGGNPAAGGFVAPVPQPNLSNPLSTVGRIALASHPLMTLKEVADRHLLTRRRRLKPPSHLKVSSSPATTESQYAVTFVRSDPALLDRLNAVRKTLTPRPSLTAMLFYNITRGLTDAGVTLSDRVGMLVDMRRYLPDGDFTLGNLSMVASIDYSPTSSIEEFSSMMKAQVGSRYPIAHTLGASALVRARRAAGPLAPHRGDPSAPVELMLSDISRHPSLDKIAWDQNGVDPVFAVALPPGSGNHITVCMSWCGADIQLTATHYESVVASAVVEDGLRRAVEDAPLGRRA